MATFKAHVKELSKAVSLRWSSRGDVASDLVLIEDVPDRRKESRKLSRESRLVLRHVGEREQFLANQVVERALRAKASPDYLGRSALLSPDFFEPHRDESEASYRGATATSQP